MLFTGEYEHSIDAKGRLAIPADVRARWQPEVDGLGWVAVPWTGGVVRLYPQGAFEARAAAGPLTLTPGEDEAELQATLFGLAARLEMDGAGRVRLPDDLLSMVGLTAEVVLVGAGDRLELRDRAAWRASKSARLKQLPELIARLSARRERGEGR